MVFAIRSHSDHYMSRQLIVRELAHTPHPSYGSYRRVSAAGPHLFGDVLDAEKGFQACQKSHWLRPVREASLPSARLLGFLLSNLMRHGILAMEPFQPTRRCGPDSQIALLLLIAESSAEIAASLIRGGAPLAWLDFVDPDFAHASAGYLLSWIATLSVRAAVERACLCHRCYRLTYPNNKCQIQLLPQRPLNNVKRVNILDASSKEACCVNASSLNVVMLMSKLCPQRVPEISNLTKLSKPLLSYRRRRSQPVLGFVG